MKRPINITHSIIKVGAKVMSIKPVASDNNINKMLPLEVASNTNFKNIMPMDVKSELNINHMLPVEMLFKILSFLSVYHMPSVVLVCKGQYSVKTYLFSLFAGKKSYAPYLL